jgi:hypothetical protein
MTNEERIKVLEDKVDSIIQILTVITANLPSPKPVYGTKRNWDKDQHRFLIEKYNETSDLDVICAAHNAQFGPRGYIERSQSSIACQLYKVIDKAALTSKIIYIAEKYLNKQG